MTKLYSLLIVLFFYKIAQANTEPKQHTAIRTLDAPKIDGVLDEALWQNLPVATNFIQNRPNPGRPEVYSTEVKVLYDDVALYIGARMYEAAADSVLCQLVQRDQIGNSDFFGIYLDTYNDKLNGYSFIVTAAGVQFDARYSSNGEDNNWNAVWESKTTIHNEGWVVEMKIPYSAIRFSSSPEQLWGVNFMRQVKRKNETYFWNAVDPAISGFFNQFGLLRGIAQIKSPLRLSFLPYISSYINHYPHNTPGMKNGTQNFNGGMDVKYGLNESFTLDMTLIPDFGQVVSDNQVLNLSPFEVRFNENRQFFTEGTELFNKGGLFYSRRIGGKPMGYDDVESQLQTGETIIENPTTSRLYNATKISGRTPQGLGIGVFNAVSAPMYATVENEEGQQRKILTQPLSNYNITVFDQTLKNNSYISLINTNVTRSGTTYDANVTGGLFKLADKKNNYAINGRGAVSQLYKSELSSPELGYTLSLRAAKISGNFQYAFAQAVETDKYNPNDMGILFNNNQVTQYAEVRYNIYKPFWKMNNLYSSFNTGYSRLYNPNAFQSLTMNANIYTTLKNFYSIGTYVHIEPVKNYDYYEPRIAGRYYVLPTNFMIGSDLHTDGRKKFALDLIGRYRKYDENNRHLYYIEIAPRYRVNDKLSFRYFLSSKNSYDEMGSFGSNVRNDTVFFGLRDVKAITSTLNSSYIFTNRMSLTLRARHYTSSAMYHKYFSLGNDGYLSEASYDVNKDINFNSFNVDMIFSWWFAPGSEVSIVWKNAIANDNNELISGYFDNFNRTMQLPQNNSISVKVLYYLDALMFKNKKEMQPQIL